MKQKDFTHLLQNPQDIYQEQIEGVKSIVEEYPYFQAARALYLKGLKDQNSISYNQELKTTAAYTTDRSILFDFITSEAFIQNKISESIKNNSEHLKSIDVNIEDISIKKTVTIDDTLKQQIKDTDGVLDPALFQPKELLLEKKQDTNINKIETNTSEKKDTKLKEVKDNTTKAILKLGKPLNFDKKETHSFNEWLKLTHLKPIDRDIKENIANIKSTEQTNKENKFKLIDKFISEKPKISPTANTSSKGNLAKAQMIQPESLMTETLARIYVEQKNYKKAIQSYKILSLKYPEKSSFFANQIRAVEQLQEHNNKE